MFYSAYQWNAYQNNAYQIARSSVSNKTGTGWENYVAPPTRKTLKQYKKEYLELSYYEIEEEKEKAKSEIKLAEQDIRFNLDLGDTITRLKLVIAIQRLKLKALQWVEQERLRRYKKSKAQIIKDDLVYIAAYIIEDEDDWILFTSFLLFLLFL